MNSTHTLSTNARYSRLKPIWLRKRAIKLRSIDSESASTTNPSPKHTNKHRIYICAVAFVLLETSFLVFAYYCLIHPIPLQSHPDDSLGILPSLNITLTELKAGVMAASVIWHSLAGLVVKDIIAAVCSAKFVAQYHWLGDLDRRTSDRVSTLTSGLVDNIVHFTSVSATGAFCLAFAVMAILMVVGPLGSGSVTVGTIVATTNEWIQVSNLAEGLWSTVFPNQLLPLIMRIEREQNETFKYDMRSSLSSDPVLIPWPTINTNLPEQSTLIYQSDILHFMFECAWITPSTVENTFSMQGTASPFDPVNFSILNINNTIYQTRGATPSTAYLSNKDAYGILVLTPLTNDDHSNNVAIMFITKEAEFLTFNTLTLSGHPHVLSVKGSNNSADIWQAAFLSCYPNSRIIPASVTLVQNTLTASKLPESMKSTMSIGNIPLVGTELMINLLVSAITDYKPSADQMFLKIRNCAMSEEWELLSVEEMSPKINLYMQSVGKAYLGGLVPTPLVDLPDHALAMNQMAQMTFPVAANVFTSQIF